MEFVVLLVSIISAITAIIAAWLMYRDVEHKRREVNLAYHTFDINDVKTLWKWNSNQLLRNLIALDKRLVGPELTDDLEGNVEQWSPIFEKHPDTWRLLVYDGKIVGYWQFVSLNEFRFNAIRDGDMIDAEIRESNVLNYDEGGDFNLYVTMLAVDEKHRIKGLSTLWMSFIDVLTVLAEDKDVFFSNACAVAYTKNAEKFCQKRGMTFLKNHDKYGSVYVMSLRDSKVFSNKMTTGWGNLPGIYTRHFEVSATNT